MTTPHGALYAAPRELLNRVEIELRLVSRQCLGTRRIDAFAMRQRHTRAWTTRANRRQNTISWQFTRHDARRKFRYVNPLSSRSKRDANSQR